MFPNIEMKPRDMRKAMSKNESEHLHCFTFIFMNTPHPLSELTSSLICLVSNAAHLCGKYSYSSMAPHVIQAVMIMAQKAAQVPQLKESASHGTVVYQPVYNGNTNLEWEIKTLSATNCQVWSLANVGEIYWYTSTSMSFSCQKHNGLSAPKM